MQIEFMPVAFDEILEEIRVHFESLPGRIDSFLECYILESAHYRMMVDGAKAGITSIHGGELMTQFVVHPSFRRYGRPLFEEARRWSGINFAFVPTCDEFYLAHALDNFRELAKQAYFFSLDSPAVPLERYRLRVAHSGDAESIIRESAQFFDPVERSIVSGNLFVTELDGEPVGFGVIEPSLIHERVASIGMFTIERFRRVGVGTATISGLISEVQSRGWELIAGCWYYNDLSKKTLERAGMYARSRLLKIAYNGLTNDEEYEDSVIEER